MYHCHGKGDGILSNTPIFGENPCFGIHQKPWVKVIFRMVVVVVVVVVLVVVVVVVVVAVVVVHLHQLAPPLSFGYLFLLSRL